MNLSLFTENSPANNKHVKLNGFIKFADILNKKSEEIVKKKRITKPFQFFGVWIAQNLDSYEHIALYISLAKYQDRNLLEQAVSYVKDYPEAKSKHNLFMWYLKGKLKKVPKSKQKTKQNKLF